MKRRDFVFTSMKAAAVLARVLGGRRVLAQTGSSSRPKRVFFWIASSGYPDEAAFFPGGNGESFELSPILGGLADVKQNMLLVDGVDIRNSGLNPKGNNHVRTVGKVLTAKNLIAHPTAEYNGLPGAISVDQLIARDLNLSSLEVMVNGRTVNHMRSRPFATGPREFKVPIDSPGQAWDKVFATFQPGGTAGDEQQLRALRGRRSLLDDLVSELGRFRQRLNGEERFKLDVHEDALRRAEQRVADDLVAAETPTNTCDVPERSAVDAYVPRRAQAHFDVMFSAFACDRVRVGGMMWGWSGYHWTYPWLPNMPNIGDIHDEVHHRSGSQRATYIKTAKWDWDQLGAFVKRLRDTPEDGGTMLDNTLVVAASHFGRHHQMRRIPMVLFTGTGGALRTGRRVKLSSSVHNDKVLTSVAHLMGLEINGIGDDPNCGPLPELHG